MTGGSPSLARSLPMVVFTVVVTGVGGLVPYPLQQFPGGDRPSVGLEEAFQYSEFLRGQREPPPAAAGDPAGRVHAEIPVAQPSAAAGRQGAGPAPGYGRPAR